METNHMDMETTTAIDLQQLQTYVRKTFNELDSALSAFKQEEFNIVPFEGSWTAGQVAEHLIKGVGPLPDQHTTVTTRPYDANVGPLEAVFLDFTIKMTSPEELVPGDLPQDRSEVLAVFRRKLERLERTIGSVDMTATCLDFELPHTGFLTRYEWVRFFCVHIRRHTWQLGNILKALRGA